MRLEIKKMATSMFLTLSLDISRTSWRVKVSDGSFFWKFNALSFEPNLCWTRNFPLTFWVTFLIRKYEWQLVCIKFQLNLWQNINEELFKVEYLIKLSQHFRNLAEVVIRLYNKTFFSKAFKVLADFNKVFNIEKLCFFKTLIEA